MTRKDYIVIAEVINSYVSQEKEGHIKMSNLSLLELVTTELAKVMQADNPRFNWNKFYTACGFSETEDFDGVTGYTKEG